MNTKHLLIVDDDSSNAIMVRDMLVFLGDDYVFEIAYQGDEALAKIEKSFYDLVITDYFMPGFTGMNLIDKIRHISPDTKLVLMTAEGSHRLAKVAKYLNVDEYIKKPFSVKKMREVVQRVMAQNAQGEANQLEAEVLQWHEADELQPEGEPQHTSALEPQHSALEPPHSALEPQSQGEDDIDHKISEQLKALKAQTGVRSVLLISSDGYPVDVEGEIAELDVISACALLAGSFMASSELARLFGHGSSFKSTYYEGNEYSIYSYDINGKMLLVIVSDTVVKPGLVSFYAKQAISNLVPLLAQLPTPSTWDKQQVEQTIIDKQFEQLFKM